jgi:hypothetical protein
MSLAGLLGRGFHQADILSGGLGELDLSLVDNADGTGLTATVAGANSTAEVNVYTAAWNGGFLATAFALAGTRTGNGDVALPVSLGYHWVVAIATDEKHGSVEASVLLGARATDGTDPLHWQCLLGAQSLIQALSLEGLAEENVQIQLLPWRDLPSPGVILTPLRDPRAPNDNARDKISWHVQAALIVAKSNQTKDNEDAIKRILDWRFRISNSFSEQSLTGVEDAYTCHVDCGPVVIPAGFEQNFNLSAFTLRFESQVVRGVA